MPTKKDYWSHRKNIQSDKKSQEICKTPLQKNMGTHTATGEEYPLPFLGVHCFSYKLPWKYKNLVVPKGTTEKRSRQASLED